MLLFVIIPLLGIALGYGISKIIIIPYFTQYQKDTSDDTPGRVPPPLPPESNNGEEGTESRDSISSSKPSENNGHTTGTAPDALNVEGFQLYRIQVGAFSSEENAMKLAMELRDQGLAASIETEDLVKVYTHYFFTKEQAETVLVKVQAYYEDAHISPKNYPSLEMDLPGIYSSEINLLRDHLKECKTMLTEIASKDGAGDSLKSIVKEQKDRITQLETQISQTQWPPDLKRYGDYMSDLYAAMLGSYSEYNNHDYLSGQISMELINCYIYLLNRLGPVV